MDEMKVKLTNSFTRGIAAKLISRAIYKKFGYKVEVQLNDLDIWVIDGNTDIKANVQLKADSKEFMKLMKSIGED